MKSIHKLRRSVEAQEAALQAGEARQQLNSIILAISYQGVRFIDHHTEVREQALGLLSLAAVLILRTF